ncbi:zinc finger protein 574-like [Lingula anatina]|uniref:Zinc finger protein 574-like n=1 Tax=Lingula anatina TaxID=7574 RepID=A0A1S3H3M8_LINAN|nr:zinc finger protein 574-like [Lingula anatina]|eukprot:XP_013379744.2 zinc finger protein 574-like [Lingula anatina]
MGIRVSQPVGPAGGCQNGHLLTSIKLDIEMKDNSPPELFFRCSVCEISFRMTPCSELDQSDHAAYGDYGTSTGSAPATLTSLCTLGHEPEQSVEGLRLKDDSQGLIKPEPEVTCTGVASACNSAADTDSEFDSDLHVSSFEIEMNNDTFTSENVGDDMSHGSDEDEGTCNSADKNYGQNGVPDQGDELSKWKRQSRYFCSECGTYFTTRKNLLSHIHAEHNPVLPEERSTTCKRLLRNDSRQGEHASISKRTKLQASPVPQSQIPGQSQFRSGKAKRLRKLSCKFCNSTQGELGECTVWGHACPRTDTIVFICSVCHEYYENFDSVMDCERKHRLVTTAHDKEEYKCIFCNKTFQDMQQTKRHETCHSQVDSVASSELSESAPIPSAPSLKDLYKLKQQTGTVTAFATRLVKRLFSRVEIIGANINGVNGKKRLNAEKIETIKRSLCQAFGMTNYGLDLEWPKIRSAIDSYCRGFSRRERLKQNE